MKNNKIKAILLDFGGVIYDINPAKTIYQLTELCSSDANNLSQSIDYYCIPAVIQYEKGEISTQNFKDTLIKELQMSCPDKFEAIWNETIVGPKTNIDKVLAELAADYDLYLLSNTNEMHYNYFIKECEEIFKNFKNCFYSFKMNLHKPDKEIFLKVLESIELPAENILFVDDSAANINTAKSLNFNTFYVDGINNSIYNLSDYLHTV